MDTKKENSACDSVEEECSFTTFGGKGEGTEAYGAVFAFASGERSAFVDAWPSWHAKSVCQDRGATTKVVGQRPEKENWGETNLGFRQKHRRPKRGRLAPCKNRRSGLAAHAALPTRGGPAEKVGGKRDKSKTEIANAHSIDAAERRKGSGRNEETNIKRGRTVTNCRQRYAKQETIPTSPLCWGSDSIRKNVNQRQAQMRTNEALRPHREKTRIKAKKAKRRTEVENACEAPPEREPQSAARVSQGESLNSSFRQGKATVHSSRIFFGGSVQEKLRKRAPFKAKTPPIRRWAKR